MSTTPFRRSQVLGGSLRKGGALELESDFLDERWDCADHWAWFTLSLLESVQWGSSCLGSLFTGALQGSMRTCWKESKGAFRHYNLSEGSWLVPWCLWAAGARALSLLVLYTYKPMLWDRSRLGGRGLEGKRDGRGTRDGASEGGFPESLLPPAPLSRGPAELLLPYFFLFFFSFCHFFIWVPEWLDCQFLTDCFLVLPF